MKVGTKTVKRWLWRYGPLEIAGTIAALVAAGAVARLTEQPALIALAGTAGENVGFYGYAGLRALRSRPGIHLPVRAGTSVARAATTWRVAIVDLLREFGPAELLDSVLVRPALYYAATIASGSVTIGVLAGKAGADLVFYAIAIACFTRLSRRPSAVASYEECRL